MGIEDEIKRQNAEIGNAFGQAFGGAPELDETHKTLKPLIDRLEGAREAKFKDTGRWVARDDSSFQCDFPAVWTEGLPNLMSLVRAVFEPATSNLFFKMDISAASDKAPDVGYCPASNVRIFNGDYYLPTGSLHLFYEKGAIHFYKGWLKATRTEDGRLSVQVQQRLGGKFHDLETAYEAIFPVYAKHVFHAAEDREQTNQVYAAVSQAQLQANASATAAAAASAQKKKAAVTGVVMTVLLSLVFLAVVYWFIEMR